MILAGVAPPAGLPTRNVGRHSYDSPIRPSHWSRTYQGGIFPFALLWYLSYKNCVHKEKAYPEQVKSEKNCNSMQVNLPFLLYTLSYVSLAPVHEGG